MKSPEFSENSTLVKGTKRNSLDENDANNNSFIHHMCVFLRTSPILMSLPSLGHAVIINNVVNEMPGSMEDVEALKATYEKIGFNVHVHTDCSVQVILYLYQKRKVINVLSRFCAHKTVFH